MTLLRPYMAEDYEDVRGHLNGNVLVKRSHAVHTISAHNNHLDVRSCGADSSGLHPALSKEKTLAENSVFTKGLHHHRRHHHGHSKGGRVGKSYKNNADRFGRTAAILRQAGLMKLTLQIAQLIKTNEDLQKEIDELQREAMEFSENLRSQIQQKLSEQNGNY